MNMTLVTQLLKVNECCAREKGDSTYVYLCCILDQNCSPPPGRNTAMSIRIDVWSDFV